MASLPVLLLSVQGVLGVYVMPNSGLSGAMRNQCMWISVAQCINKNYPGNQVAVTDVRAAAKRGIAAAKETALDGEVIRGVNDEDSAYDDVNYEGLFQVTREFGIRIAITAVSEFQEAARNPAHVISTSRIDETMVPELHEGMPLCQIVAYDDKHFELFYDTKEPGTIDIRETWSAAGFGQTSTSISGKAGPYRGSIPSSLPAFLRAPPPLVRHHNETHAHTAFNEGSSKRAAHEQNSKAKENEKELMDAISYMEGNAEMLGMDEDVIEGFATRMRDAAKANDGKLPDNVVNEILKEINEAM